MSQGPGYVSLSDPADEREAQTGIWDCEGANHNLSALFGHRGGAAEWTVWRRTELMWAQSPKGTHPYDSVMFVVLCSVRVDFTEISTERKNVVFQSI